VAVLVNPANAMTMETTLRDVEPVARAKGLEIQVLNASTSGQIDGAFATLADSEAKRPVIPTEGGHPIRSKAATDSDRRRPPCWWG